MTAAAAPGSPLDPAVVRDTVETLLRGFLDEREQATLARLPELALFTGLLRDFLEAGGKRIRPQLCVAGWQAITDLPPPPVLWGTAASLELFHAFCLIHDDVMDHSDTRRGRPTAHRALAAHHAERSNAEDLGINAAILLGDLALGWSYELLHTTEDSRRQLESVWPLLSSMRTDTLVGQYLDLVAAGKPDSDVESAWRIVRYKTAKYTIETPLVLGATLAGATREQLRVLSAYAIPLGEAFQLRDDLLGMYGHPEQTGKPILDDLREGKRTVLVSTALRCASAAQKRVLRDRLGNLQVTDIQAAEVRDLITATGAPAAIEHLIDAKRRQALRALTTPTFRPHGNAWLRHFAHAATTRTL
ncbi:polyprenyl synthetase family protein [Streptomyces sp. cmx-4-9]|uniref:polyprenyl synthetase family protein n=1 Tax=Streptomyces sp. cmx-4-9 TaxID=2790941 RepID=UPI0039818523